MPRCRARATILKALRKLDEKRQANASVRHSMEDSSDSDSDGGFMEDIRDAR